MSNSFQEKRARHQHFIKENGILLNAMAWEYYSESGRGILCVRPAGPGQCAFTFENAQDVGGKAPQMAEEYDPERELVLAIFDEGVVSLYRFGSPQLPPPAAYAFHKLAELESEKPEGDSSATIEPIFNLFLYVNNGLINEVGIVRHELAGSVEAKIAFLQSQFISDLKRAKIYDVPRGYFTVTSKGEWKAGLTYEIFMSSVEGGNHLSAFRNALIALKAPENPVCTITPVVDGVPRIEAVIEV